VLVERGGGTLFRSTGVPPTAATRAEGRGRGRPSPPERSSRRRRPSCGRTRSHVALLIVDASDREREDGKWLREPTGEVRPRCRRSRTPSSYLHSQSPRGGRTRRNSRRSLERWVSLRGPGTMPRHGRSWRVVSRGLQKPRTAVSNPLGASQPDAVPASNACLLPRDARTPEQRELRSPYSSRRGTCAWTELIERANALG